MKLKNKYVIGTHVMFYEIDMIEEFIESCANALDGIDNPENVTFDFCLNLSQYFEKFDTDTRRVEIISKWHEIINTLDEIGVEVDTDYYENDDKPYCIGDYRRDLNSKYCMDNDFVIWGESDCLLPRELFVCLEEVSRYAESQNINKYITTFGVRKMWDDSWAMLQHPKFDDATYHEMHHDTWQDDPSSIWYTMSKEEMYEINDESEDIELITLNSPRFDGSGLVISTDLIKNGCNVPHGVWSCGEDTAFQNIVKRIMGSAYTQFVVRNILKVHNRNHPKKREYVKGEENMKTNKEKRKSNERWMKNHETCQYNLDNVLGQNQNKFRKIGEDDG
jgi:hypothetical protein|tara:strand:+ start:10185 stop:11186 length:1002 start_codon:yes stop_codon:yes gene_type:complete